MPVAHYLSDYATEVVEVFFGSLFLNIAEKAVEFGAVLYHKA